MNGQEVFRYVGKSNTDRMPFDQLAAKVADLSKSPAGAEYNLAKDGLALAGHDPVAYFDANSAVASSGTRCRLRPPPSRVIESSRRCWI